MDDYRVVLKAALDAGIEERKTRVAEDTARVLVEVIDATLSDPALGLSAAKREAGRKIIARHLRAVE